MRHAVVIAAALAVASCSRQKAGSGEDQHEHGNEKNQHETKDGREGLVVLRPEAVRRMKIRSAPAAEQELEPVIETTGEVAFDQDRVAQVSARIQGRVRAVRARLGQAVQAGEILALVESPEIGQATAELLRSRAQLELARQKLAREERLFKERISSGQELEAARADHQKARAEERAARQRLQLLGLGARPSEATGSVGSLPLRAPIAGKIVERAVTLGEMVGPEKTLFTVADLSRVWIWIDIFERDLAHVHREDRVEVRVASQPDRVFSGQVGYVGDQVRRETRTVRARLDIDNRDGALKPGMFARVRLSDPHAEGGRRRRVLAVPASAVQRQDKEEVLFVELAPGRFERREVQSGVKTSDQIEVRSGLRRGERVVVEGAFLLKSELAKESLGEHEH